MNAQANAADSSKNVRACASKRPAVLRVCDDTALVDSIDAGRQRA
jgi:hypothetical protein